MMAGGITISIESEEKKMEEKNKTNIIETGVVEVKVTANWGTGESIQMNNDAEPIRNI